MDKVISVENVNLTISSGAVETVAVRDVSMDIYSESVTVIMGQSGCGKSSLLNVIGGMKSPTSGRVIYKGEDIVGYSDRDLTRYRRDEVGFVFQNYNLISSLTAIENVNVAAALSPCNSSSAEILDLVGLKGMKDKYPRQLSGGEQQRVCIARALVKNAGLLLCDEPGIELEEGFARRHGLKKGDHIEIKGHDLEVTGICRQYLCSTQYVSKKQARELGYVPNVVTGSISDADRLKEFESDCAELDGFMEILLMDETRRSVEEAMAQIDIPCNIFIACSFILGYVIMLNMSLISFSRRKRDIATLRALGTENRRIFRILAGEALVEFLPACLIAPLAFPLIEKILLQMSSVSEEYVLVHRGGVLLLSCLVALLCTTAGVAGTYAKVKKMDFASELNNRD